MSNHSPYNNELANKLENIPMPDINMAWADMEKRLTKKDDKKPVPFWLNGCGLLSLVGLILLGIGVWFYISKNKVQPQKNVATTIVKDGSTVKNNNIQAEKSNKENELNSIAKSEMVDNNDNNLSDKIISRNTTKANDKEIVSDAVKNKYKTKSKTSVKITSSSAFFEDNTNKASVNNNKKTEEATETYANKLPKVKKVKGKNKIKTTAPTASTDIVYSEKIETTTNIKTEKYPEVKKDTSTKKDSIANNNIVQTITNKEPVLQTAKDTTLKKATETKKNKSKLFFNAGIGMQQQIPIDGQTTTPYNSLGRKGTLLDYIPSVYARIEKDKKWFIQIEGKYGAPQYNKQFVYAQVIKQDTGFLQNFVNINSTSLKKSYYHQIPITFNYYITPKWSLGAGLQWNKFTGALAETELVRKDNNTQTQNLLFKEQVLDKLDTNNVFTKQYSVALFETQYKWKRFTIGGKYSFGLKPYIVFTLPNATEQKLTSKTALVFIKYELWRCIKRKR